MRAEPAPVLIALDIDGTLAAPGVMAQISDTVRAAVARVLAAGHHVVLASGRSLPGVLPVAKALGLTHGWLVASNGAVTASLDPAAPGGYVLGEVRDFDPEPVVDLVRSILPDVGFAAERAEHGYDVTRQGFFRPDEAAGAQQVVPLDGVRDRPTPRLVLRGPGADRLTDPLRAAGFTVTPVYPDWVEATALGLSKAAALEKARVDLGVPPDRTVAVGDGLNDLEMLRWAAKGVAMGHAPAVVREAADEVTGTLGEDGVAAVLDALDAGCDDMDISYGPEGDRHADRA